MRLWVAVEGRAEGGMGARIGGIHSCRVPFKGDDRFWCVPFSISYYLSTPPYSRLAASAVESMNWWVGLGAEETRLA